MYKNPYQNLEGAKWCKTNFHTHAGTGVNTCGSIGIQDVVDIYEEFGYDILCISNHDLFSDTKEYSTEKILLIPGVEYSQGNHMLTIGVEETFTHLSHQEVIDNVNEKDGFVILCHPNWIEKEYWKLTDIDKLNGYTGIEVINQLIYRLSGSGLATDTWDYLLTNGKQIYGFGNDDFHRYADAVRSFNIIYCERNYKSMKNSIKDGKFCASTGLFPDFLKIEDDILTVGAKYPIKTYINTFTYRFIGENGKILSIQTGKTANYKLQGELYVRVEVIAENGMMLFFQPVFKE